MLITLVSAGGGEGGLQQNRSSKVTLHLHWSAITSTLCNTQIELYISVLSCKNVTQNIHLNNIYNSYVNVKR